MLAALSEPSTDLDPARARLRAAGAESARLRAELAELRAERDRLVIAAIGRGATTRMVAAAAGLSTTYVSHLRGRAGRPGRGEGDPGRELRRLERLGSEIAALAVAHERARRARDEAVGALLRAGGGVREAARLAELTSAAVLGIRGRAGRA
jgi:hypothetical protein